MRDNEIIELYWSRSEDAISETAAKYSRYCTRIAQNIVSSLEDAEECANDTWLRAWNAIPPARPNRLAAFLGKITRNLALNLYQKKHALMRGSGHVALALSELEDCIPDSRTPQIIAEDNLIAQAINTFLAELDDMPRKVFVRRYWYLSGIEEIAGDYGMSISKVKSMLHRLRKRLRKNLEKEGVSL